MRTEELIGALAADHGRRSLAPGASLALAMLGGTLLVALAFALWIGPRPDFAAAAATIRFPFKFVLTLCLAAAALGAAARLARPEAALGRWRWALLAAPALLALAVAAELLAMPAASWWPRLVGTNAGMCLTIIPLLSIAPLALALPALRRGAPTRPALAGAAAGLLAGGIAATFYAANCFDDSPLFVAAWYPLAIGLVALAGALIGTRALRW
jgi:hypothetical protein